MWSKNSTQGGILLKNEYFSLGLRLVIEWDHLASIPILLARLVKLARRACRSRPPGISISPAKHTRLVPRICRPCSLGIPISPVGHTNLDHQTYESHLSGTLFPSTKYVNLARQAHQMSLPRKPSLKKKNSFVGLNAQNNHKNMAKLLANHFTNNFLGLVRLWSTLSNIVSCRRSLQAPAIQSKLQF